MCHLQCTTQGSATYRAQVGWLYDLTRFVWKANSKDNCIFKSTVEHKCATYSAQHKAQQHIALRLADCVISPSLSEKQNQKTITFSSPRLNTNVQPTVHNTRLSNISRSGWLTVWSHQVCLKSKLKRQLHFQVHCWTQMCHLQCTTQGSATYRAQVGWLCDLTKFVWKAKSKDNYIFKSTVEHKCATYSAQHKVQQHIALRLADCMISPGLSEKQNQKTIAFSSPLLNTNVPPTVHNTRLSNISRSGWLTVWSHQVCLKSKLKRQLHFQVHCWTQMCHLQCTTQGSATYRAQVGWLYDFTRFVWKAKSKDNRIFKSLGSKTSRVHVLRQLRALFTQVASWQVLKVARWQVTPQRLQPNNGTFPVCKKRICACLAPGLPGAYGSWGTRGRPGVSSDLLSRSAKPSSKRNVAGLRF